MKDMLIAFIGCDGSGKTTLAKRIISKLKEEKIDCEYRHQYNYFISKSIGEFLRKRNSSENKNSNKKESKKVKLHYKIWPFISWFNLIFNFLFIKTFKKNKVVVFDRYIYDLMIGWELQGRLNFLSRFMLRNFPEPDLIFLLDAKTKTLYNRRKDEYSDINFCEKKKDEYIDFAEDKNIEIINTEDKIKNCTSKVLNQLKEKLS